MKIQDRFLHAFAALALFSQIALAQQPIVELRRQTFEIVWGTVKQKHFDPKLNGVDWDAVRRQYEPRVADAGSDDEFYRLLNAMLGELKQSHFAVIPPSFFALDERDGGKSSRAEVGVTVQMIEGRPTITRVERDSTAFVAGLRPGFIVMSIGAESLDDLHRKIAARKERPVTAEEILEKNIVAIGGRKAIEKGASYCIKATLEMQGRNVQGELEICGKAPDKLLTVTTINKIGVIKQGFDGKTGWSQDPYQGLRTLEGDELEKIKHQAIFNPELKWRELFIKAELAGKEKVGGQNAYVIRLTGKDGAPVTRYYDATTFLLLRADAVDEGPQGKIPVETLYMDYREVDGVKSVSMDAEDASGRDDHQNHRSEDQRGD